MKVKTEIGELRKSKGDLVSGNKERADGLGDFILVFLQKRTWKIYQQ